MILVAGATGMLGSAVCRRLRGAGRSVRALVRATSPKEEALRGLGVEVARGDLRAPGSLDAALEGVTTVISTATAMASKGERNSLRSVDRDGQLALVAAARSAGAAHFVYVSISPNYREHAPLMRYKREVERAVRHSGMRWTVLQPSNFMEVWLSPFLGWDLARGRATIFGAGTAPVSWISVDDVAEVCALAISDPRLENQDLPLGGPEALPPNAVLAVFEGLSGRRFKARRVPRAVLALLAPVVALLDERQASGMSLGAQAAEGDVIDSPLQRELPVAWTRVRDYGARILASQRA